MLIYSETSRLWIVGRNVVYWTYRVWTSVARDATSATAGDAFAGGTDCAASRRVDAAFWYTADDGRTSWDALYAANFWRKSGTVRNLSSMGLIWEFVWS
jgi:hypothetical protein